MFLPSETVFSFAHKRNHELSFSYLKENGELLSIAASTGLELEPVAIEYYRKFYDTAYETCVFFPQYFRFILAIVLDLEDLGLDGTVGQKICDHVRAQNYIHYETSDTRRLEILNLLERRNPDSPTEINHRHYLHQNVDKFISNPDHFIKFNKPLFYDLTHYIFFLTNYGQRPCPLQNSPIPCLTNIGILALLDDDADLLAEVCICFHFLGETPPRYWENYVKTALSQIEITFDYKDRIRLNPSTDQYHTYFVNNWLFALQNQSVFSEHLAQGTPYFSFPEKGRSLLSLLSESLYATQLSRTQTESECLGALLKLSDTHQTILSKTITSSPQTARLLTQYSQGIFNAENLPA